MNGFDWVGEGKKGPDNFGVKYKYAFFFHSEWLKFWNG